MKLKADKGKTKDEWLTPPSLLKELGEFDLDPCSPIDRPWDVAKKHYTYLDNGLMQNWVGRVYCNPPYGSHAGSWVEKCAMHGNAIALVPVRAETNWFFNYVWDRADALFFIKGRISFYHVTGESQAGTLAAPTVLIAYGQNNIEVLRNLKIKGKFIKL